MNKNHKTLYMILAVLLVSFLFFGSREKEVVEGFQEGMTVDELQTKLKDCDKNTKQKWKELRDLWASSQDEVIDELTKAERDPCSEDSLTALSKAMDIIQDATNKIKKL